MSDQEHKKTWNIFTKFILFGTLMVILILIILALTLL
ncbi:aa3-type cytochrome c oxidase subunit IV [Pelagibacteraceae bacterium]|nr:aa3-type cytochrome c oxidase subunit IV [Pelagibacteraceae bacterium]